MIIETNILICYTHESELRMQSYDAMKMPKKYWNLGGLSEILDLSGKVNGTEGSGTTRSGTRGGAWFNSRWI